MLCRCYVNSCGWKSPEGFCAKGVIKINGRAACSEWIDDYGNLKQGASQPVSEDCRETIDIIDFSIENSEEKE